MSMDSVYGHEDRVVPAGQFKQNCFAMLDEVAEGMAPIIITKRGRPVARVVPVESGAKSTDNSVRIVAPTEEALFSTGEYWEADYSAEKKRRHDPY
jgi:prevent-host-death family protein